MFTFNEFIGENELLSRLKEFYDFKPLDNNQNNFLKEIYTKILHTEFNNYRSKDIDLIGNIYERTVDFKSRKELGEFYTPKKVVNHILESIGYTYTKNIRNKKLIDISCGAGSFLIESVKVLKHHILEHYGLGELDNFSSEIAKNIVDEIRKSIYGLDLNPISCILCQLNLFLSIFDLIKIIKQHEPTYQFDYFEIKNFNSLTLSDEEEFDYVVGNPPYLFIREINHQHRQIIEESNLKTNIGQYDYYQIFIEIGLNILTINGVLGYIIPDSILALSNRKIIRKFIFENSKIKEISIVGSQFEDPVVSNVILILEKENDANKRVNNNIKINQISDKMLNLEKIELNQHLIKKFDYKFLVNLNSTDMRILEHLNDKFPKLNDIMSDNRFKIILSRGVELGKEGKVVYCNRCEQFLPFPKKELICSNCKNLIEIETLEKIIRDKLPIKEEKEYQRFIYKMNRYNITEIKFINVKKKGINYKDNEIYKDRIVIRQLNQNKLICASYDSDSYTSQSFYNLKVVKSSLKEFNNYYLLGLINSRLLSYYYNKSFGSYKKLFPRILIEKIKNLPIKVPYTENEKRISSEIIKLVKEILMIPRNQKDLEIQLDTFVFELYEILEENRIYISQDIMKID